MADSSNKRDSITWDSKDLFSGTAWYYARYRPDYPDVTYKQLLDKFKLNNKSRVLDLGCGTGQLALGLAPHVADVIAVDPVAEMLEEGRASARIANITNITWLVGESRKLKEMAEKIGEVELTVMGKSFHWMDRAQTLQDLYRLTRHGGGIAIIADSQPRFHPEVPWINAIDETVKRWLGEERKAGTKGAFAPLAKRHDEIVRESEFQNLEILETKQIRQWTLDTIIGYLYSASPTSLPVLGDKKEPFEADLRKRLMEISPDGRFAEHAVINIIIARKTA